MSAVRRAPSVHATVPVVRRGERPVIEWDSGGDGFPPRLQVAEIQRTRLLTATVSAVDELGYADVTVAHITERARVSRRTFYELFANREECLAAVSEDTLERVRREMVEAGVDGLPWRERVRGGLWAILSFFDREPALARVCVVQMSRGNKRMLERRAEVFAQLARFVDEGSDEGSGSQDTSRLVAEGLVGAAHAIVYERVLKRSPEPLTQLFTALMGMIVLPYLGPAAARRERSRATPSPAARLSGDAPQTLTTDDRDRLQDIPIRLTYRTARVLQAIAETPGISNRSVGDNAGVADQGQISKLLARLERLKLIVNVGEGHAKGEANAWKLTTTGQRFVQSIHLHTDDHTQAA